MINYKEFYHQLQQGLGLKNVEYQEDPEETGYFALLSKRQQEFPKELVINNKAVIDYLIMN